MDIQLGLDARAPGGEDQQQHMGVNGPVYRSTPDTSVRRSGREVEVPERFGDVPLEQLSSRNRKRIQSLAARKVPREE